MPTDHTTTADALKGAWKAGGAHLGFVQLGVTQPSQPADTVNIITVTQNAVAVQYNTLVGNVPSANANTLFLWQTGGPQVPWNVTPYGKAPIPSVQPNAAAIVSGNISQSGYIVGYAVGATVGNIVATSYVPNPSNPPQTTNFVPGLSLYLPPTSAVISLLYSMPPGSTPQTNNHWVGIYTGAYATFGSLPDAAVAPIPSNVANTSISVLPPSPLTAGATYTAAYFAGGYNSTTPANSKLNSMCALITFQVPTS
jgi:hypothetical protein